MGANALIENVFRECIKACANTTYTYIFNNCNQLHAREFGEDQKVISDPCISQIDPSLRLSRLWKKTNRDLICIRLISGSNYALYQVN